MQIGGFFCFSDTRIKQGTLFRKCKRRQVGKTRQSKAYVLHVSCIIHVQMYSWEVGEITAEQMPYITYMPGPLYRTMYLSTCADTGDQKPECIIQNHMQKHSCILVVHASTSALGIQANSETRKGAKSTQKRVPPN